jgi:hypothetical protein
VIFRISKIEGRSRTDVTIDGHLAGDYVQTAETYCGQAVLLGKPVHVFLKNVSSVDEAGRRLLSRLVASGCRLHASGTYNSYLVQTLQPAGTKHANSTSAGRAASDGTRRTSQAGAKDEQVQCCDCEPDRTPDHPCVNSASGIKACNKPIERTTSHEQE